MFSPIEEIKSKLDIVELVQGYVRLQKSGVNFKATCPFHTEKTPSFYVTPARQIWHCFGCGKGGDIFKFVMEIEGHDFPEALKVLASRAGVVLKREDPLIHSERNRLYDLVEEAAEIFEKNLSLTPAAKTYLKKRGMSDETIRIFRIGFAPQSWDHLLKALTAKGYRREEVEKAGLAARSQDGTSWYDRFRKRIMFPITDGNGRVIGFGGRIFDTDQGGQKSLDAVTEAKYINSPTTPIYDKSRVLYGFDKAKQEIRTRDQVVIVEGYMDCVMSHQAGVPYTVAVSGTALTGEQLKMLRRLTGTIISSFDTDAAGDSATKRSLALAAQFEFVRKVARIPTGKDPADTVSENPVLWQNAVRDAKDIVAFYFEKAFRDHSVERVEGKKAIAAMVLPYVSELTDEIEKAHWVSALALRLSTPENAVWEALRKKRSTLEPITRQSDEAGKKPVATRRELLEEQFLTLLSLAHEKEGMQNIDIPHVTFSNALFSDIFLFLNNKFKGELTPSHKSVIETLKFKGEILAENIDNVHAEFLRSQHELEKACIKEKLVNVSGQIEQMEREGTKEKIEPLLKTFRELSQSLTNLT